MVDELRHTSILGVNLIWNWKSIENDAIDVMIELGTRQSINKLNDRKQQKKMKKKKMKCN